MSAGMYEPDEGMIDITPIENFVVGESGRVEPPSYIPPHEVYSDWYLDTLYRDSLYVRGSYKATEGYPLYSPHSGIIKFKLQNPTRISKITIVYSAPDGTPSASLVASDNSFISLYTDYFGDYQSTSTVNGSDFEVDGITFTCKATTWEFPEFLTTSIIIGMGSYGVPQEYVEVVKGIYINGLMVAPVFWTDFTGQFEIS